ncbi:MAG: argininosuccinate synthase [Planctomycetes bacterium]|nr:argininosuccinate synthase [Planctomycetota bacterium]
MKKVILGYTGNWDTDICLHYLKNIKGFKVIAFHAKFSEQDVHPLMLRSVQLGADATHIIDLTKKYLNDAVVPAIRAHVVYEDYYLSIALTRPLIVEEMLKVAKDEGCEYIAHGASFRGNDFVRFHNLVTSLNKDLKLLSPLQELGINSIRDAQKYSQNEGIHIENSIMTEENIWGSSSKYYDKEGLKKVVQTKAKRYAKPSRIDFEFRNSLPVAFNGKQSTLDHIVRSLNEIGGSYGIGFKIAIEDTLRGGKELFLYKAPAGDIIYTCLSNLEKYVFDKGTLDIRRTMSDRYAQLIYEGKWFMPVRHAIDKLFLSMSKFLSGRVSIELSNNSVQIKDIESKYSLL